MLATMQICMKLSPETTRKLKVDIAAKHAECGLSYSEIGRISQVHTSQVSRICRGKFSTLSHNVVQVCKALGLPMETAAVTARGEDAYARELTSKVLALWDRTPADAERLSRLLGQLAELRSVNRGNGAGAE